MLDVKARQLLDPFLDKIASRIVKIGIGANQVTLAAFGIGILAAIAIVFEYYITGLVLVLLSRLGDGLDGAVARQSTKTDFGGFLDIVLDFIFYGMIPVAFIIADPAQNAFAGSILILSFFATGSSFLAYAVMAERYGLDAAIQQKKSLYYAVGLAEATETIAVFVAFCLFPDSFALIAWVYSAVCFFTVIARILQARSNFKN